MSLALLDPIYPTTLFVVFIGLVVFGVIAGVNKNQREEERSDQRARQQTEQSRIDAAMRGVTIDLARRKAGLEPLGFDQHVDMQRFLGRAFGHEPMVALPVLSAPPTESASADDVIPQDEPLPLPEVSVLIPDRILSFELAKGVNGVIGFYAGEIVALRSIQIAEPEKFGLPASEYSCGQVEVNGRSDEQLLVDAMSLAPGVFMQILTDPATEQALRSRAA